MDLVSLAAVYPGQVWLRASAGVHKVQYDFQKLMAMNWTKTEHFQVSGKGNAGILKMCWLLVRARSRAPGRCCCTCSALSLGGYCVPMWQNDFR